MSWFRRGPSLSERVSLVERQLEAHDAASTSMLRTLETLIDTVNDVIETQAVANTDHLSISIALTKRLFATEEDVKVILDATAALGIDVTRIRAMHLELIDALRRRESANSGSTDLPKLVPGPIGDDKPN